MHKKNQNAEQVSTDMELTAILDYVFKTFVLKYVSK